MAQQVSLRAETGRTPGSAESRRIRRAGGVPGIVYGGDLEQPIPVTVDHRDLRVALSTEYGFNVLIDLEVDGTKVLTMPRQVEMHPYKSEIRHVDFLSISLTDTIETEVAIHLEGTPVGVRDGGVLSQPRGTVTISALPNKIPGHIEVDVSHLEINDVLRIADLPQLDGVEYIDDLELTVASVTIPRAAIELEAAEEAAAEEAAALMEGEAPPEGEEAPEGAEEESGEEADEDTGE